MIYPRDEHLLECWFPGLLIPSMEMIAILMSNKLVVENFLTLSGTSDLGEEMPLSPPEDPEDFLGQLSPQDWDLCLEYAGLALRGDRSPLAQQRLAELLAIAEFQPFLSFWLDQIDQWVDHQLSQGEGLVEDHLPQGFYANQQALLLEYAGLKGFPVPRALQVSDYIS